jgi:hypothetical protein
MADKELARLEKLSNAFARIADQAQWLRAGFIVHKGRFTFFGLGRPDDVALTRSLQNWHEMAIVLEVHALTDQAGALLAEVFSSRQIKWKIATPYHHNWLMYLLHTPPLSFQCQTKGSDGRACIAFPQLGGGKETGVWIDHYAQVCVSALAHLKCSLLPLPGQQPEMQSANQLRNARRDAWVAKKRSMKNPQSWQEIYDEGVTLAPRRRWEMPGSPKALQEAYRRYLSRQRLKKQD